MTVDPFVGKTIGSFRIREKIGEGGMGAVYRAIHTTLQRDAAFKILPAHLVKENPSFVKRFLVEARAAAKLNHPNIVQVYDAGEVRGVYFIAMEFVRGMNIREFLERTGTLSEISAVDIVLQASLGLEAAKEEKIIHRDIKPDNLMIMRNAQVKVMDFGLAKNVEAASTLTQTGQVIGTPTYMSPEQGEGEPADFRSDIYSLGATLFELVTHQKPYEASSAIGVMIMHVKEPVPDPVRINPGINKRLRDIIQRMMAKRPHNRYQSYGELIEALADVKMSLERKTAQRGYGTGATTLGDLSEVILGAGGTARRTRLDRNATRMIAAQTRRKSTLLTRPEEVHNTPHLRALYWGFGALLVAGVVAMILGFSGVLGGGDEFGNGTANGTPLPIDGGKGVAENGDDRPGETAEKPLETLKNLLSEVDGLEKEERHGEALELLGKAAGFSPGGASSAEYAELLAVARGRLDLVRAREMEIAGRIGEAIRLARSSETHGIGFAGLDEYVRRLERKKDVLGRFPPGEGWSPDRKKGIMLKMINGGDPTPDEKLFYQRFQSSKRW